MAMATAMYSNNIQAWCHNSEARVGETLLFLLKKDRLHERHIVEGTVRSR